MAEGQGRSSEQGVKLLYIRDYLHKYTNKEHPKSAKDIIEYLASKGIKAERKTIYNDILRLQMDFQEPIEYNPKKWGYYITKPQFSVYDLQILLDCVRSANFLTSEDVSRISKKIVDLGNVYDGEKVRSVKWFDDNPVRPVNSELYNIELIQQAITENRRISFRYYIYYPTHSNRATNGKTYVESYTGNEIHIVSPKKLTHHNGHYVLECYRSDSRMKDTIYPVEFLENMVVLSSERECINVEYNEPEKMPPVPDEPKSLAQSYRETLDKIEETTCLLRERVISFEERLARKDFVPRHKTVVTLIFKKENAIVILNEFGYDTVLVPITGIYCSATIRLQLTPQFFNWLFLNRAKVIIYSPDNVIEMYRNYVEAVLHHYDIWSLSTKEILRRCYVMLDKDRTTNERIELYRQLFYGGSIDEGVFQEIDEIMGMMFKVDG